MTPPAENPTDPENSTDSENPTDPENSTDSEDSQAFDPAVQSQRRPPIRPAFIAAIAAIPAMVIAGFVTYALLSSRSAQDSATPLDSLAAPQHNSEQCQALIRALPERIDGFAGRSVSPDGLVRWAAGGGQSGPVTLRCGVDRPAGLVPSSVLTIVAPVQWFASKQDQDTATVPATGPTQSGPTQPNSANGTTWYAVDRRPYVALWLPGGSGNAPITEVTEAISKVLPATALDLGDTAGPATADPTGPGASAPVPPASTPTG